MEAQMPRGSNGNGSGSGNANGNPELPNGTILAVAFNDLNGNHTFDKKDMMIAALVDTNKDNVVSIGDTVAFGHYPLHIDGTGVGTFQGPDETVIGGIDLQSGTIGVKVSDGFVYWQTGSGFDAFFTAVPNPSGDPGTQMTNWGDVIEGW